MRLGDLAPTIETFRSLGFGSCLGTGSGLLIYSAGMLPNGTNPYIVALGGGLLGTGLHLLIDVLILRLILQPLSNAIKFYAGLMEAFVLGRVLDKEERQEVVHRMILERIEGKPRQRSRQNRPRRSNTGKRKTASAEGPVAEKLQAVEHV